MKNLYDYIVEASTNTAFANATTDWDELLGKAKKLNITKYKIADEVKKMIDEIFSDYNDPDEQNLIYAIAASSFKIPYAYTDSVVKIVGKPEYSKTYSYKMAGGNKVVVSYRNKPIFETGSGSIGKVSTADQETATTLVWNAYVEEIKSNPGFELSKDTVKEIVKELAAGFDNGWITTFIKQVSVLTDYLKAEGLDPLEYKMFRYGDNGIGKVYAKYIQAYTTALEGQKDNFDPADDILYKADAEGQIEGILSSLAGQCTEMDSAIATKNEFVEQLFNQKLLLGISLKKIAGNKLGEIEKFNIVGNEKIEKVDSFEYKPSGAGLVVNCWGTFNLAGLTQPADNDADKIKDVKDRGYICVTMRTFGGGTVGIDVTMKEPKGPKSPSLGKCPVRIWKAALGLGKEAVDIDTARAAFEEMLKSKQTKNTNIKLAEIIAAAVKEGPSCFPFVLLH